MITSQLGHQLPESLEDFEQIKYPKFSVCHACAKPFGPGNTSSMLGWRETQISGSCESCFDKRLVRVVF